MITLNVIWRDRWHWWHAIRPSAYAKGEIHNGKAVGDRALQALLGIRAGTIYRHKKSGQIRCYSDRNLDGHQLTVNSNLPVTLRQRGRHGKLYLGFEE